MSRKSRAALEVVQGDFGKRPSAPAELTNRQKEIWNETTNSEAIDFFATAALRSMLADYCRHRESAEKITSIIDSFEAEWMKSVEGSKRYSNLIKMRDLETRASAGMATKLRLTNQARYTPQAAATSAKGNTNVRPWEA